MMKALRDVWPQLVAVAGIVLVVIILVLVVDRYDPHESCWEQGYTVAQSFQGEVYCSVPITKPDGIPLSELKAHGPR